MNTKGNVGFLGSFQADFIYYCARTLARMDKKVLVVDESSEGEIRRIVFAPEHHNFLFRTSAAENEKNHGIVTRSRVDFTSVAEFSQLAEHHADYDYILFYFGASASKERLENLDEVFAFSFCDAPAVEHLRDFMTEVKVPMHVILRNVCGDRSTRKSYFYFLEHENAFIAERFLLPFDEIDETYRIRVQYEAVADFREISSAMEQVVVRVLALICPEEKEKIRPALRRAKKGDWL